ncbi:MAG: AmmeMemoRadiSam system protein B [candidate division Zixibacteria bacterium]|nr:AmmeMemoRadiSam system protein B [candidate division Zixibacteria bacterium]
MSDQNIRQAAVAGAFYPDDPGVLSKMLAGFFNDAKKKSFVGRPIAMIAPHAGYAYSGKTAADGYKQLLGENYETVVVIAPSHTVFFQGISVFNGDAYSTPLGEIKSDKELAFKIGSINPAVYMSNKGHSGGAVRGEHSLEVQLPFLQQVLGSFKLVAIVMGEQEESSCRALGEVLATALTNKNCLIVASTDLSHFNPQKEANRLDKNIQTAIEEYNSDKLLNVISSGRGEACGGGPVAAALLASKRLGGEKVHITGYSTSGETTGDFSEVVGYLSAIVTSSKKVPLSDAAIGARAAKDRGELSGSDKAYLANQVVDTIKAKLDGAKLPNDIPASKLLLEKRGAFVTLKIDGNLRGCIGLVRAAKPIYEAVREMALAAAFEDPRFAPVTKDEFPKVEVEISVLSQLAKVHDLNEIKVGRDGLMIRLDFHSGLLLPQVASENDWDRTTFLEQTCLKAGLPKNSYKDKIAEIYRFSADIF